MVMPMRDPKEFKVSPSQINLFLTEPAIWVMNRLWKVYGDMGPAAWRGTAVEKGLEAILVHNRSYEDAIKWANTVFKEEAKGYAGEDLEAESSLIEPMLKQAINLFLPIDGLQRTQVKLEGEIHGVLVTGIMDFVYEDFVIDLKTTKRCPSAIENISSEHMTQLAIYRLLSHKKQRIAYATDKKGAIYDPPDSSLNRLERRIIPAIKAMKRAWDISFDEGDEEVAILYPPRDMSSFYWNEKTRMEANKIWNLGE